MFDIRNGSIFPNGRPGLGIELIPEAIDEFKIDVDSPEAQPDGGTITLQAILRNLLAHGLLQIKTNARIFTIAYPLDETT
ncbi:MAG: hypothetical protein Ct9H300mP19_15320 [Dehalococcoidia bacterium]|nr:MAG: hypothetical protein Ct9H300mP19_15320 [Dehalococcoidia bacterium]